MSKYFLSINNYDCLNDLIFQLKKQGKLVKMVASELFRENSTQDEVALSDILNFTAGNIENCVGTLSTVLECVNNGNDIDYKC